MTDAKAIRDGTKPPNFKNKAGMRFGRLVVIKQAPPRAKGGGSWWLCRCDCGREVVARGDRLDSGITKSCRECGKKKSRENLSRG